MAPWSVQSRRLSNFGQSLDGWPKIYYLELHASEGTLSRWVPATIAVVSTHQPVLDPRGYGPFSLCVIYKEGLSPSSGNINRLMMITKILNIALHLSFIKTNGLFLNIYITHALSPKG
jgi:hypothetical protein